MQKYGNSKRGCGWFVNICALPLLKIGLMIGVCLIASGCNFSKNSVTYVDDSDRIVHLEPNQPAPFDGVLITAGRFEELLDYEDKVLSGDCR